MELTNKEMSEVNGGAARWGFIAGVAAAAIAFLIGFTSGYSKPIACNK